MDLRDWTKLDELCYKGSPKRRIEAEKLCDYGFFAYFEIVDCSGPYWYADLIGYQFLGYARLDWHWMRLCKEYRGYEMKRIKEVSTYRVVGRKFFQLGRGFNLDDIVMI